jgi:CubicO group peptidase (beta-lactamase class C family)
MPCQQPVRVQGIVELRAEDVLTRPLPDLTLEPSTSNGESKGASDGAWDGEWVRELPAEERARLDDVLRAAQKVSKVHAVSAAVHVLGRGGWRGIQTAEGMPSLTAESRFHAGSIGKALTAALVSGLLDPDVERGGSAPYRTAEQVLTAVERGTPMFLPGQKWSYCNAGYQLLGLLVAREREESYEQALQRLLDTVGLRESTVVTRSNQREVLVPSWHGGRSGFDAIDYAVPLGAGLLASTPRDLLRWHAALLSGRVLPRAQAAAMLQRLYPMDPGALWWGRGLMVLKMPEPIGEVIWSAGRIKGFGAEVAWLPTKRVLLAVMVDDDTPTGPFLFRLAGTLADAAAPEPPTGRDGR